MTAASVSAAPVKTFVAGSFSGTPTTGPAPLEVQFRDQSSSTTGITSWAWSFGDGGSSTSQNPKHTYKLPGQYTVKLTIVDAGGGSATYTKTNYIKVEGINSDFKANSPTSGLAPLTVDFMDLSGSDSGITSWAWSFGNGQTSNAQYPPPITYNNAGSYTVKLTVGDGAGNQATEVKNNYIRVQ